jgi:hypothetical protein
MSEISNTHKINQTEYQIEEFQYDDAMARYVLSLQKFLAQKSLKTELWLKRYEILKLQGLDCKTVGVRL